MAEECEGQASEGNEGKKIGHEGQRENTECRKSKYKGK